MPQYKTNDGTMVDTNLARAKYKGVFRKGRIAETLYCNYDGQYYLVSYVNDTCEWYCADLAIPWLRENGHWDLPGDLIKLEG